MGVPACAVDDRSRQFPLVRAHRKDIAPNRSVGPAAIVYCHDGTFGHLVDEVTDRPAGSSRSIGQGEGASAHPERLSERLYAQTLTGNTELVERVAEGRRVNLSGPFHISVSHHESLSRRCS